jgi:polyisoprenoid-binding protein YceI
MSHISPRSGQEFRAKPPRRRHWWRWAIGSVLALVVLAVVAAIVVVKLTPAPAPLALPDAAAAAPAGQLDGTWQVAPGSLAGFRIRESILGVGNDVTGRTGDVTGTVAVTGAEVSRATFRVNLDAIAVDGKARQPQLVQSLDTAAYPVATVTLTRPVPLTASFSSGGTVTRTAAAALTLNGTTRPVTVTLSARRDGTTIEAAGSLPVTFADFGIKRPSGYGFFGSLADNGTAEFLLILELWGCAAWAMVVKEFRELRRDRRTWR